MLFDSFGGLVPRKCATPSAGERTKKPQMVSMKKGNFEIVQEFFFLLLKIVGEEVTSIVKTKIASTQAEMLHFW